MDNGEKNQSCLAVVFALERSAGGIVPPPFIPPHKGEGGRERGDFSVTLEPGLKEGSDAGGSLPLVWGGMKGGVRS